MAINDMFREVRTELVKTMLLNRLLNTTILFLALDLLLKIFSIPFFVSLFLALAYFVVAMIYGLKSISVRYVEERNPQLKEMLRTAYDNRQQNSLIAKALFFDVIKAVRKVSSGTFIDFNSLMIKIAAIFILGIILVGLTFFDINISVISNPLQKPLEKVGGFFKGLTGEGVNETNLEALDENMYGQPKMADLSKENVDIKINPSLSSMDFKDVEEPDPSQEQIQDYPGDAVAKQSGACLDCGLEDINERKTAAEYSEIVGQK